MTRPPHPSRVEALSALLEGPLSRLGIASTCAWSCTPGASYKRMERLAVIGHVRAVEGAEPRRWEVTDAGRAWLEAEAARPTPIEVAREAKRRVADRARQRAFRDYAKGMRVGTAIPSEGHPWRRLAVTKRSLV